MRLTGLTALWLIAACSTEIPDGPSLYTDDRSGEATTVKFFSFAGGCIRQDSTESTVAGLSAELRPFRRDPSRIKKDIICTADLRLDNNVVELRFSQAGQAKVRIIGVVQPGDRRFVLERNIEVTP